MLHGTGTTSIVKRDLPTQIVPAVGFQKTQFAHKAASGDTGINLNSLTTPPEMSANGFTNPPSGSIAGMQILVYRRNLRLWSSLRGEMTDYYQYYVSSNTQIVFLNFTAEEGEIFRGTLDYNAVTGANFVATLTPPATGSLAAGTTDFNCGFPFQVNQYPTMQSGAVRVYRGTQLMARNTGNATASISADGDYQEVDNGTGFGTIIRFNRPDPDNANFIQVIPSSRLAELPSTSLTSYTESIQGQLNSMASYVAALSGTSTSTILGAAPTQVDLKAFGDRVIALENNRARIDLSNTWTAYQQLLGRFDGTVVPAGYIGEVVTSSAMSNTTATTTTADVTGSGITLSPGIWEIKYAVGGQASTGAAAGNKSGITVEITTAGNVSVTGSSTQLFIQTPAAAVTESIAPLSNFKTVVVTSTTTYKLRVTRADISGTGAGSVIVSNGVNTFYATRIG